MISIILEFMIQVIIGMIFFLMLFPVVLILSTPYILISSLFISGSFSNNVLQGFCAISKKWINWGVYLLP